jgi:transposase-like protein
MARAADLALAERWRERLARRERIGLSIAEFCRRERISQGSFHQWRRRLAARRSDGPTTGRLFVPVELTGMPTSSGVRIALASGATVALPSDASLELVTAAIRAALGVSAGKDARC